MGQYLAAKLLKRAGFPLQGETDEITLRVDHTLTRDTSVPIARLRFKTIFPAARSTFSGR